MEAKKIYLIKALNCLGFCTLTAGSAGAGTKIYLQSFSGNLLDHNIKTPTKFKSIIEKLGYKLFDEKEEEKVKLVLVHVLDPHSNTLKRNKDDLFIGSSPLTLNSHQIVKVKVTQQGGNQTEFPVTWIAKPDGTKARKHRTDCSAALEETYYPGNSKDLEQLKKLIKWCTSIDSNAELLAKNGFTFLDTDTTKTTNDDEWKQIIAGGWFTKHENTNYWEQQSFFNEQDLKTLLGENKDQEIKALTDVKPEHINLFKNKCKAELSKAADIKNFPLSTLFKNGIKEPNKNKYEVDSFYETTFFCTKPMKAREYLENVLKAKVRGIETVGTGTGARICSLTINTPYDWYTYQPAEGKGFWCGVKELYAGSNHH
ncbi:hypothetical protein MHSWG343_10070 [Candidatus Mycoplasma haematohominis]|uniref:Uncharacterized protein n=1 Tax=Candidatus Mycoplasma haematohominis TaxID=1494318 RepID=A0A478FU85_9MOLU|nr:hypothetical protein MHSWG343_10070 [Candidatus Mycoplasma haemohominis]